MHFLLNILLSTILLPASGIYNAYIYHGMERDLPRSESGVYAMLRTSDRPIVLSKRGDKAVLMIHGFTGSPHDFGDLPESFEGKGYDVFVPLLPAHGRGARAMADVTSEEWLEYVSQTYREVRARYDEVVLLGLSMGASLSIIVSGEEAVSPPDKLILLAPFFKVRQPWYYVFPVETYHRLLSSWIPYVKGSAGHSPVSEESAHADSFPDQQYMPTHAAGEAFEIAKTARREISKLEVPTLVIHSQNDRVTDYGMTRRIVESLPESNIRLLALTRSNHVLPLDTEAAVVEDAIMSFLSGSKPVLGGRPPLG